MASLSFALLATLLAGDARAQTSDFAVSRIWADETHNAFTDLIHWNGRFYCAFRTGAGHVPRTNDQDGQIRLIASTDGEQWESVAELAEPGIDLRDPKLSITPDGRLMVLMGGSTYRDGQLQRMCSRVVFWDRDAAEPGGIVPVKIDQKVQTDFDWLWRVTWHQGIAYGVVYQSREHSGGLHLMQSADGVVYEHRATITLPGRPNETTIRFDSSGQMVLVVRNEVDSMGHIGVSAQPFTDFQWSKIGQRLGGPNMIQLEDDRWILGTREYTDPVKTIVAQLEIDGQVQELLQLPSGGDTSYPGMLRHQHELWVSYYSSHEGQAAIYLAKIPLRSLN